MPDYSIVRAHPQHLGALRAIELSAAQQKRAAASRHENEKCGKPGQETRRGRGRPPYFTLPIQLLRVSSTSYTERHKTYPGWSSHATGSPWISTDSSSSVKAGSGSLPVQLAQPQKIAVEELSKPEAAPISRTL
jgi:hypothetical protein